MTLSIIIPVHNEEKTLKELVSRVMTVRLPRVKKEIILVDDKSIDGSRIIMETLKKKIPPLKLVFRDKQGGKGAAVRSGFKKASGDYLIIQDADLEYDPQDIPKLINPILLGKAQVVYGSRFTGEHRNMFFWHLVGNKFLSLMTNILYNTTLSDIEVCYKIFPRNLLKKFKLKENGWGWDPEITAKILKTGVRIYEVPISYTGREFDEGKKISWKDAFRIMWVLLKCRFIN